MYNFHPLPASAVRFPMKRRAATCGVAVTLTITASESISCREPRARPGRGKGVARRPTPVPTSEATHYRVGPRQPAADRRRRCIALIIHPNELFRTKTFTSAAAASLGSDPEANAWPDSVCRKIPPTAHGSNVTDKGRDVDPALSTLSAAVLWNWADFDRGPAVSVGLSGVLYGRPRRSRAGIAAFRCATQPPGVAAGRMRSSQGVRP